MTLRTTGPLHPPIAPTGAEARAKAAIAGWARSPQVRAAFKVAPPVGRWVVAGVFALTVVGIPVALGIFIGSLLVWSRRKRVYAGFLQRLDRARPLWVYTLMVNTMLRRQRNERAAGLVIGSFAPGLDHAYFGHLFEVIELLRSGAADTEEAKFVAELFDDEQSVEGRRRLLPASMTGGVPVYAFDLMIDATHLPHGRVAGPVIPCVAEPGEAGFIMTVPYVLMGDPRDWLLMIEGLAEPGDASGLQPS